MTRSLVALLPLAPLLVACGDMLGYGDIRFDRERRAPQAQGPEVLLANAGGAAPPLTPSSSDTDAATLPPQANTMTPDGGAAAPVDAGPRRNTSLTGDVCTIWREGRRVTDSAPWTPGANECDPGSVSQAGIDDTLVRIAMYRALVGLAPVTEQTSHDAFMACSAVASWNPPQFGNPHAPPPTAKCYTPSGAAGAGAANIGWGGRVPADAIDQFIEDIGNDTTFGHRRWLFNPSLGAVGIGFYAGGGTYGSAQCLGIADFSGNGPSPDWIAFPPPGNVPIEIAGWTWSFHHRSAAASSMTVTRVSDGASLPMTMLPLSGGFGAYAVTAFRPTGWSPAANESYDVAVHGVEATPITYRVVPVSC